MDQNEFDVIVIGSGLAGLTAGISACEKGAETIILEKNNIAGGSSSVSNGEFAACCTSYQKHQNINDSSQLFFQDIMTYGDNISIPELVNTLVENSNDAFKKLLKWGAEYNKSVFLADGHSVPRSFQASVNLGISVISPLYTYYKDLSNSHIRFNLNVIDLIIEGNKAVGVITDKGSKIYAKRGIIFASGGFTRDISKILKNSDYKNIPSSIQTGATADTLIMLLNHKVQTCHLDNVRLSSSIALNDLAMGVLIDLKTCKRFISETTSRIELMHSISTMSDKWPLLIFDSKILQNMSNMQKLYNTIATGEIQSFDSIEEIAEFYEVDKNTLKETIDQYNNFIINNKDIDFNRDLTNVLEIKHPPFYTDLIYPKLNYTQGGVSINKNAQVIDNSGNIIENLFACGEVTGGIHGEVRLTCCSTTDCTVFGIIAGENAAEIKQ